MLTGTERDPATDRTRANGPLDLAKMIEILEDAAVTLDVYAKPFNEAYARLRKPPVYKNPNYNSDGRMKGSIAVGLIADDLRLVAAELERSNK